MNVPEITKKIDELFDILKYTCTTSNELAEQINSILIHGDGVPVTLLSAAWSQFAQQRGVLK